MGNTELVLMALLTSQVLIASSQDLRGWWNIDCGSRAPHYGNDGLPWETDDDYTTTGTNSRVQQTLPRREMNTLRYFSNSSGSNCYTVPTYKQTLRYIVRAGFHYGNYDKQSRPPTFDLFVDGEKWATVNTPTPVHYEAIFATRGSGFFKICLIQTRDGEAPFMSTLEVVPLWVHLYPLMEWGSSFHLVTRINLGGPEIRFTGALSDELYNRIWTSGTTPSNCVSVDTTPGMDFQMENSPPFGVLSDSIQPINLGPIILSVDLPRVERRQAYFVFYFAESKPKGPNETRTIDILIDSRHNRTVETPDFGKNRVVTIYPVPVEGSSINVTLAPTRNSTLPPLIAGMEVFTRSGSSDVDQEIYASGAPEHASFSFAYVLILVLCLVYLLAS